LAHPLFATQGCSHDVNHQAHGQHAVQKKSDDGPQYGALSAKGFSQGHQQGHIQPGNNDQIHFNLGDIKLKDTESTRYQKNNFQETRP
jgi:hypothetical protein